MEVNNNIIVKDQSDTGGMYEQNNVFDLNNCNFENRIKTSTRKGSLLIENDFEPDIITFKEPVILDTSEPTPISLDNKNLLINNQNLYKPKNNLIEMSIKYKGGNNLVNFNSGDFNKTDDHLSVTNDNSYSNPDFWKKVVPNIITNDKMYRDVVNNNISSSYEGFTQDFQYENDVDLVGYKEKNNMSSYKENKGRNEPRTAPNYELNWTEDNNKIVHAGKSVNNYNKYKFYNDIYDIKNYSQNWGSLNYFNQNWQTPFESEFKLKNVKRVYTDPNGNTLDFDVCENNLKQPTNTCLYKDKRHCKNQRFSFINKENNKYCEVDSSTPVEYSEMIRRNEMFIASFNNVDNF